MSKLCICRYRAPGSYVEYLFKPKKFGRTTANYKGSEKEEKVSRDLPGFSLTLRPRKIQTFLSYYYYFFSKKKNYNIYVSVQRVACCSHRSDLLGYVFRTIRSPP